MLQQFNVTAPSVTEVGLAMVIGTAVAAAIVLLVIGVVLAGLVCVTRTSVGEAADGVATVLQAMRGGWRR